MCDRIETATLIPKQNRGYRNLRKLRNNFPFNFEYMHRNNSELIDDGDKEKITCFGPCLKLERRNSNPLPEMSQRPRSNSIPLDSQIPSYMYLRSPPGLSSDASEAFGSVWSTQDKRKFDIPSIPELSRSNSNISTGSTSLAVKSPLQSMEIRPTQHALFREDIEASSFFATDPVFYQTQQVFSKPPEEQFRKLNVRAESYFPTIPEEPEKFKGMHWAGRLNLSQKPSREHEAMKQPRKKLKAPEPSLPHTDMSEKAPKLKWNVKGPVVSRVWILDIKQVDPKINDSWRHISVPPQMIAHCKHHHQKQYSQKKFNARDRSKSDTFFSYKKH
jgi:hypothetical protein